MQHPPRRRVMRLAAKGLFQGYARVFQVAQLGVDARQHQPAPNRRWPCRECGQTGSPRHLEIAGFDQLMGVTETGPKPRVHQRLRGVAGHTERTLLLDASLTQPYASQQHLAGVGGLLTRRQLGMLAGNG